MLFSVGQLLIYILVGEGIISLSLCALNLWLYLMTLKEMEFCPQPKYIL